MPGKAQDETAWVTIGQVVGTHGIRGGLKVRMATSFPERFAKGNTVKINGLRAEILRVSFHKDQARIETDKIDTCEAAEGLKWADVSVPASQIPDLEDDEYLTSDLIGLEVVGVSGEHYGKVLDVLPNPAHDIFVLAGGMIPVVKEFVKQIDIKAGTVTVQPIPGMVEEAGQ